MLKYISIFIVESFIIKINSKNRLTHHTLAVIDPITPMKIRNKNIQRHYFVF
jgi:hypothetical protein